MKVIVGLGNPGAKYDATRHNVGFWTIDALARRFDIPCEKEKFRALVGEGRVGNQKVLLVKPQTYMNLSGESVQQIVQYYRDVDISHDILIVYDDMDFIPGQFKLRLKGRAGGHNGVKSLIACLGTEQFPRVRIGIARPAPGRDIISHVLGTFSADDEQQVKIAVDHALEAIICAVTYSFERAMNLFNG
jgi:peptidyl-tRNA hydrolase, PTH1 family